MKTKKWPPTVEFDASEDQIVLQAYLDQAQYELRDQKKAFQVLQKNFERLQVVARNDAIAWALESERRITGLVEKSEKLQTRLDESGKEMRLFKVLTFSQIIQAIAISYFALKLSGILF